MLKMVLKTLSGAFFCNTSSSKCKRNVGWWVTCHYHDYAGGCCCYYNGLSGVDLYHLVLHQTHRLCGDNICKYRKVTSLSRKTKNDGGVHIGLSKDFALVEKTFFIWICQWKRYPISKFPATFRKLIIRTSVCRSSIWRNRKMFWWWWMNR